MKALQRWAAVTVVLLFFPFPIRAETNFHAGTVVAWGYDYYGQTDVPPGLKNVIGLAARGFYNLALKVDGTVVAWGYNGRGATHVPVNLTEVVAVAAGGGHGLALLANGKVVAWGDNSYGQTNIPAGLTNAVAIAAGDDHSLAVNGEGKVVAWGFNGSGRCNVPVGLSNVVAVAAGTGHSLALTEDGKVVAWGSNNYFQTNVPSGLSNVVAIAGGHTVSMAVKTDGKVVAWGSPFSPTPGLTNAVAIAVGGSYALGGSYHSVAIKADRTVIAWGLHEKGQTNVPTGLTNVLVIAAGESHSLAAITPGPAIARKPPASILLPQGANTNLSIFVRSDMLFATHWFLNGLPIAGATTTNLAINLFNLTKAGAYSVIVSNAVDSDTAMFIVRLANSPVVRVDGIDVGGGKVDRVDSASITMTNTGSGAAIYFTLDGSAPDFTDAPYTGPFTLTNSTTIRAIAYNSNYTDSAEAAAIAVQIAPTYPLVATTPGGGSVSVSPAAYSGGDRFVSNTVVTLTATPSNGWSFLKWTGDSTSTSNVTTVLMDRPRVAEAVFGTSLNLFTNGNGHVFLDPATGPYPFGSAVRLTALPAADSYFFGWGGAASGFSNPLHITATNAAGITALFGTMNANQVSLTVLPEGGGSVSVSPSKNVYTNGEAVRLTALPGTNRVFTSWSGGASGNLNPLELTLTGSTVITANFAPGSTTNPPVITQPPLSRTLSAGASTLLSFGVTGDGPLSYQWRLNSSPVSGATNATLTLSGVTPAKVGRYDVVVSGASGSATSAPAAVALFGLDWTFNSGQGQPLLILDAAPGLDYRLEYSWDLSATNWNLLAPLTLPASRVYYVDSVDTNFLRRFYRAVPQ